MLTFGMWAAGHAAGHAAGQQRPKIDFAHDVLPVLKARCTECHTSGKYKGGLSLDTREELLRSKAVVPGKSTASELMKRVTSADADSRMPPKGDALTAKEIDILRRWIDEGLIWEAGFSFKTVVYVAPLKPRRPTLPPARLGCEHPIDRIVAAYFARHKVMPPPTLDDNAFLRRIYLDLVGLLPAPQESDAFFKDTAPDKRTRLIRRLLDERRTYADHWLSFWNDLLRNDYSGTGYIDGGRKQISGWLYPSLADNKPFDQFVRELISPANADNEGFIKGIKWRGNVNASQTPELQFSQNVAQVFFGINMKCASCHDSFIDTWKLDDAYALAAIVADRPLEIHRCDKGTGKTAQARFLWPELGAIDAALPKAQRLERFAQLVTHPENGRFTRTIVNRYWQRLMGRGIVHPVDIMANPPWSEDLLDYLAVYLADNRFDLKKLLEHIVTSQAYQSQSVPQPAEEVGAYVFRGPEVRRLSAEQFLDALWMTTRTGPVKHAAPVKLPDFADWVPAERQLIRASLEKSDALMRSLGRPNREHVVTTRPDQLTTLQALDLSNGKILAELLERGAAGWLKSRPGASSLQIAEELFQRTLCRKPTAEEIRLACDTLGTPPRSEGLADLMWLVYMLPEFQLIR
jgi:hypothetical protein